MGRARMTPMPITGRLTTAGRITMCSNYPQEFHDDLNFDEVSGVVLEMGDTNLRLACGKFLGQRVAIWSAGELADLRGTSAMEPTPEDMQHLAARLAAAEDHLAREVRSNEAAALVRKDIEKRMAWLDEAAQVDGAEIACLRAIKASDEQRLAVMQADLSRIINERDAALAELGESVSECRRLREWCRDWCRD